MFSQKKLADIKLVRSHAKRNSLDARAYSYYLLQYVEKHRVVGLQRHRNLRNGGIQYRFPIR